MPNNITNKVTFEGTDLEKIKNLLTSEDSNFDFSRILPIPAILTKVISGSIFINNERIENPIKEIIKESDFDKLTMSKSYSSGEIIPDNHILIERKPTDLEVKTIRATGFNSWYDWSNANWGTKWNAYSVSDWEDNIITFQTAWSGIVKLIGMISEKFPETIIKYLYASEDTGYNVGSFIIQNGIIIEDNSPEDASNKAYEIYLELNPNCDYIKLVDEKYVYVDEED